MGEIDVFGLPIPDAGPVFLAALAIHVVAGGTCVVGGAVAALTRKGGARHIRYGRTYLCSLAVLFVTATIMAVIRWREDAHLFVLGLISFSCAAFAFWDRRRAHRTDTFHIAGMGLSYVVLLTAFYVDNGPHLPLWNLLPTWAFWLLPGLVGLPLTARAGRRRQRAARAAGEAAR
jgi:hypothetical protein